MFRNLGVSGRCVIPTTDPTTGTRDDDEQPREVMLGYRPLPYGGGPHGGPTLGIWAAPTALPGGVPACRVRVGDPIRIISRPRL